MNKIPNVERTEFHVGALTEREAEVMTGLAKGLLYKEIANKLGISFSAVHKRQHRIFRKLRVSNRSEAIMRWQQIETSDSVSVRRRSRHF